MVAAGSVAEDPPRWVAMPDATRLAAGYLIAWRAWTVWEHAGALSLRSFAFTLDPANTWPARQPYVARCRFRRPHVAPVRSCSCGIYGYARLSSLLGDQHCLPHRLMGDTPTSTASGLDFRGHRYRGVVVGRVALWGHVIEHEGGYRAQYAYPQLVYATCLSGEQRAALASAYGIEVYHVPLSALRKLSMTAPPARYVPS